MPRGIPNSFTIKGSRPTKEMRSEIVVPRKLRYLNNPSNKRLKIMARVKNNFFFFSPEARSMEIPAI
jgi:hypothetical protein